MKALRLSSLTDSFVYRQDGRKVRQAIESALLEAPSVEIDFEGRTIASISFLDEAIACLALDLPLTDLKTKVRIVGLTEQDRRLLNSLVITRSDEREGLKRAEG